MLKDGTVKREYNDGRMITWLQGMMATVLGNAGQVPEYDYNTDPMNMHALQARWVLSIEIQKNIAALTKADDLTCYVLEQAWCPGMRDDWRV
jgi:hypothetical protein